MLKELLTTILAAFAIEQQEPLSLKHLSLIFGYHTAKKLEQTGIDLNETAYGCAKLLDSDILPADIKNPIIASLDMDYAIKRAYARSYHLLHTKEEGCAEWGYWDRTHDMAFHNAAQCLIRRAPNANSIEFVDIYTNNVLDNIDVSCTTTSDCNCKYRSIAYNNALNILYVGRCGHIIQCIDPETHECVDTIPTNNFFVSSFVLDEQKQILHMRTLGDSTNYNRWINIKIMQWDIGNKRFLEPIINYNNCPTMSTSRSLLLFNSGEAGTYFGYSNGILNHPSRSGHSRSISSFYLDTTHNLAFSGSHDCSIKIWDAHDTGTLIPTSLATLNGHTNEIDSFAFDTTSDTLYSKSYIRKPSYYTEEKWVNSVKTIHYIYSTYKTQIKAWRPQCNLNQVKENFTVTDWVITNTPPLTSFQKARGFIKGLTQ